MNTTLNPHDSKENHSNMSPTINLIDNNSTHIMLSTQAQQVNNANHMTPHVTYSNKGNHRSENNKHNHNTTIYIIVIKITTTITATDKVQMIIAPKT